MAKRTVIVLVPKPVSPPYDCKVFLKHFLSSVSSQAPKSGFVGEPCPLKILGVSSSNGIHKPMGVIHSKAPAEKKTEEQDLAPKGDTTRISVPDEQMPVARFLTCKEKKKQTKNKMKQSKKAKKMGRNKR
ncbi:hypothetical protein MHYP_G00005460, partial [Metynnis hypsauchen]